MHNDESIGIPDAMSAAAEDLELTQTSRESDQILKSDVEIAYQNKDISSKFFTERLKGKSLGVYGMELPEVEEVLPTNIPIIKVNELRLDNLLGLADGSVAVVDYESEYRRKANAQCFQDAFRRLGRFRGAERADTKEGKARSSI